MRLFIALSLIVVVFLSACGSSVNTNPSYITVTKTQDITNTITQQNTITQNTTQTETLPPQTVVSTLPPITSIITATVTSIITTTLPPITTTISTPPTTTALQPLILGITHINTGADYSSPITALYTLTIQNNNSVAVNSQALAIYFTGLQGATLSETSLTTVSGGSYLWAQQGTNLQFANYPNISIAANTTQTLILSLHVKFAFPATTSTAVTPDVITITSGSAGTVIFGLNSGNIPLVNAQSPAGFSNYAIYFTAAGQTATITAQSNTIFRLTGNLGVIASVISSNPASVINGIDPVWMVSLAPISITVTNPPVTTVAAITPNVQIF